MPPPPDVVNCSSIDLRCQAPFSELNLHYGGWGVKGPVSAPATINLLSKAPDENGSCCRIHPKRLFPPLFLGVIKRCFS